jgi:hypothetical protein
MVQTDEPGRVKVQVPEYLSISIHVINLKY